VLGPHHGTLTEFSFHYGRLGQSKDPKSFNCPKWIKVTDIRFDLSTDQHKYHLHYYGPDHIPQNRVIGCKISDMDRFSFIRGIEAHRTSKKPLNECFGFEIRD